MEEDDVRSTYRKVKEAVGWSFHDHLNVNELVEWAQLLTGMDENYFRLVKEYVGDQEPWRPFFDLAQKLMEAAPAERMNRDRDLTIAYGMVDSARRHIRHVSYFYILLANGRLKADSIFPEGDVDDEIIGHLLLG
jgi:hypothetical protein